MPPFSKKILICPLDWGLGHASRCIPIIEKLIALEFEVIIAANNNALSLLQHTFPTLHFIQLPGFAVRYSKNGKMNLKMLLQVPAFLKSIKNEHQALKKIIEQYQINVVISDNRYGCYAAKIPSIFITHQLNIQAPFFKKWLQKINYKFINRFDECWIPDVEDKINLSGLLGHNFKQLKINHFYMGILSRFNVEDYKNNIEKEADVMLALSGPEPQRTIFENTVINQLSKTTLKAVVVRGLPSETEIPPYLNTANIEVHNHLNALQFLDKINKSALVIARSGYSTLMDLAMLGKKAILVPTPGQTEQVYLGDYHHQKKHFFSVSQKAFNLEKAIQSASNFDGITIKNEMDLALFLKERISFLTKNKY